MELPTLNETINSRPETTRALNVTMIRCLETLDSFGLFMDLWLH